MKKVFAFLSVFALTIAFVGFSAKPANAAELMTEDPTLNENQIPMYIMDSIYTTFPSYYDYATAGDDKWPGAARMYPWNETRFNCKLIDDNGEFTGQEYSLYFAGALNGQDAGAGNNILFYKLDDSGNPVLARMNGGKWGSSGVPMDPSLSHMRTNITGQDLEIDAIEFWSANGSDNGGNMYNRMLVFDKYGRMTSGISMDGTYVLPDAEGAQPVTIAPEYCYVNGAVEKIQEGTVCDVDRVENEDTGEVTETTKYITNRFVWQYFSAEEFDPSTVNEVAYLSEGWDAQKWDYVNEEEDGYVAIAFVSGAGGNYKLTADQLAVYTATCEAQGLAAPDANTVRRMARTLRIPDGGWTYDFGYLDQGCVGLCEKFIDMFIDGYRYGRKVTVEVNEETGEEIIKGMAYQSTHDFSASPIYAVDKAYNGVSYQVMDGQNVIEVLQGETVYPSRNVAYAGMAKYWQVPGDLTSYTADTSVLEMYIKENGLNKVQPATGYTSLQAVIDDFFADIAAWKGVDVSAIAFDTAANFQGNFSWGQFFPTNAANAANPDYKAGDLTPFWSVAAHREKWSWLLDLMYNTMVKYDGGDTYTASLSHLQTAKDAFYCGSPQTIAYAFWYFLNGQQHSYFGFNFQDGRNVEWLDTRTNLEKWEQYSIDTSTVAVDTNFVVDFTVYNPNTNLQTELTLTYVVVDEYTPILQVNKNNLIYAPTVVAEKVQMPVIDKYTLCTAYNARYNGVAIKGDNISYKVHYTSETLDFDNPTEGAHKVTARVYNQTKYAEKTFTVYVEDITAPRVLTVDVITVAVGGYFDVLSGIIYAYDAVDGNLLDGNDDRTWYADNSVKPVDTSKEGKYNVSLEIWDKASNTAEVSYVVNVVAPEAYEDLSDEIASNKQAIEEAQNLFMEQFEELNEKIDSLNDYLEEQFSSGCGSKSAVMVQFLAAASLLVVFLRKRH